MPSWSRCRSTLTVGDNSWDQARSGGPFPCPECAYRYRIAVGTNTRASVERKSPAIQGATSRLTACCRSGVSCRQRRRLWRLGAQRRIVSGASRGRRLRSAQLHRSNPTRASMRGGGAPALAHCYDSPATDRAPSVVAPRAVPAINAAAGPGIEPRRHSRTIARKSSVSTAGWSRHH